MRNEVFEHRDLALKLLVGRSLKSGLPWSQEDDDLLIALERRLWVALTPEEQAQEQEWLQKLWGRRGGGSQRKMPIDPLWGDWAATAGDYVVIPDSAFGMPREAMRPWGKGVEDLIKQHPEKEPLLRWLWSQGFQPTMFHDGVITLVIPAHRVVQETERLLGMLNLQQFFDAGGFHLEAHYNPLMGMATITLVGKLANS